MVVMLNRVFICLVLVISLSSCVANAKNKNLDLKIVELAEKKLGASQTELENVMSECRDNLGALPVSSFEGLSLTSSELFSVIFYKSNEAIERCEKIAWGEYFVSMQQLRSVQKSLQLSAAPESEYETLKLRNSWRRLKLEIEYESLDQEKKLSLEKLNIFSRPFDPTATANALGI